MYFQTPLFNTYLWFYSQYRNIRSLVFSIVGRIMVVNLIDHNKIRNITLNYYTGINLPSDCNNKYYVKIYSVSGTHHMAFLGSLSDISKIRINTFQESPRRRKMVLTNNDQTVDFDLRILDNYYINNQQFGNKAITNLADIISLFGLKVTHVSIIESRFSNIVTRPINDTDLQHIYY